MTSLPMPPLRDDQRLWLACGGAVCLHLLVLFGLRLGPEIASPTSLEVTLLASATPNAPLTARVLAPVAQAGGGDHRNLRAQQAASAGLRESSGLRQATDFATRHPLSPDGGFVAVTATTADHSIRLRDVQRNDGDENARLLQRREQAGDRPANTARDAQTRSASDDSLLDGAGLDTRASRQAAYRDTWRQYVERAGAANFPWSILTLGQPKSLTLQVIMRSDGSIASTRVLRSSGMPMLDMAALDILRMAGPFPPFPKALRQDTEELSFSYKWEFLPGDRAALHVGRP